MLNTKKKIIIALIALFVVSAVAGFVDLNQVKNKKEPIFAISLINYENTNSDGGTITYVGLFYYIQRDFVMSPKESIDLSRIVSVSPWFMPFINFL